jgi:hypothetical protein
LAADDGSDGAKNGSVDPGQTGSRGSDLAKNGSVNAGQIDQNPALFHAIYSGLNYLSATFRFLVKLLASLLTVIFRSARILVIFTYGDLLIRK